MPIAGASEMAQHDGATSNVFEHDTWKDRETLKRLAVEMQQCVSPFVAIETLDAQPWAEHRLHQPQALLCDLAGIAHLFGGELGLLRVAQECLARHGYWGRMAIANSVGAAWALAHYAEGTTIRGDKWQVIQDGWIVPADATRQALEVLPVASLRIPQEVAMTLQRLGIETVGELLALPKPSLASRLGDQLVLRINQALGEVEEPLSVHRHAAEHRCSIELEYPTSDQCILADRVQRLIANIRTGMATRNRGALRLACRLDLVAHPSLTFYVGLFTPTLDVEHLTDLVVNQLDGHQLPAPVERVSILVLLSSPLSVSQNSLFDTSEDESSVSSPQLAKLVNSLSGRLGRDAVVRVSLSDNPLPEHAYRAWSMTDHQSTDDSVRRLQQSSRSRHLPSKQDANRRPLSLFSNPVLLQFDNQLIDQQVPQSFRLDGTTHRVLRYWGPERLESNWWRGPCVRRDYFRIETDREVWWWVFRDFNSTCDTRRQTHGCWMLHGYFA